MSRKFRRSVASTLALAMMAGSVSSMPALQLSSVVIAADTGATVTVNSSTKELTPGSKITITTDITGNDEGLNAILAWISYNNKAFEIVSWDFGNDDEFSPEHNFVYHKDESEIKYKNDNPDIGTIVQFYQDNKNLTGNFTLSKITFQVKADAKEGEYEFAVGGDPVKQNGLTPAQQNRYVNGDPIELSPVYNGLKVKVGAAPATTTPAVTTPAAPVTTVQSTSTPAATTPAVTSPATTAPAVTTPAVTPTTPVGDKISIRIGDVTGAKPGTTVTVPVYAENIGAGLSTVQFDYAMDDSFKIQMVAKGDFDCQWTVGTEEKSVQFLEKDGNNIPKDGVIGRMRVVIPADAKEGTYPISISNFEGSVYDGTAQAPLEASAFTGVNGKIVIGDAAEVTDVTTTVTTVKDPEITVPSQPTIEPTDVPVNPGEELNSGEQQEASSTVGTAVNIKIDAGKYKVNPGETFKLKINVTENDTVGYSAVNAYLDIDTTVFDFVSAEGGDSDDEENEFSLAFNNTSVKEYHKPGAPDTLKTLVIIYNHTENTTEKGVFATVTLKVKDDVKNNYYSVPFDMHPEDGATAVRILTEDGERVSKPIAPKFLGGIVQVGDVTPSTPSTPPVTTASPAVTEPSDNPGDTEPLGDKVQIKIGEVLDAKAGTTVTVPIYASNIKKGISTVQFDYDMKEDFKVQMVAKGDFDCQWTVGTEERSLQFLEKDGNNITKDGVIGRMRVVIPEGTPDGIYPIRISNFEGSVYDTDAKHQDPLDASAFAGVAGRIVIGELPAETTPAVTEAQPAETTPAATEAQPAETTPAATTAVKPAETTVAETTAAKPAETTPAATTAAKPAETTPAATEAQPAETTVAETTAAKPAETTVAETTAAKPAETTVAATTAAKPAETTPAATTAAKPAETTVAETTAAKPAETTPAVTEAQPAETTPAVTEPAGPAIGDVDDNGVVNTLDLMALKRYLLLAADKSTVPNGDLNGDKTINTIDLIHFLKIILNK